MGFLKISKVIKKAKEGSREVSKRSQQKGGGVFDKGFR